MKLFFLLADGATRLIATLTPLFLALGLMTAYRNTPTAFRRSAVRHAAAASLFAALDWALLAALPRLNLSYGPLAVPLAAWLLMRWALFMGWVVAARQRQLRPARVSLAYFTLHAALVALLLYGFYYEPFNLGLTRLEQNSAQATFTPVRIAHVTDIHLERITRREEELLALLETQRPDLILLTGDYLNLSNLQDPEAIRQARWLLSQLHAPLGVFAVSGTVDNEQRMHALFDGLDITVLEDEAVDLPLPAGRLRLLGIGDEGMLAGAAALATLIQETPADVFTVLLHHTPDLAEAAAQAGVDLYFAGHTHGGQVRLPLYGALITLSHFGKRYEMGDYQVGSMRLYVSRGIGMEGWIAPRVRFLCPPEVVLMDLKGTP